jgi:hypothetical protein
MSGRIEMYDSEKEETSKWSKNEAFKIRSAGVDIGNDNQGGGGGTTDYRDLENKPLINGYTLVGDKDSEDDLGIPDSEPLTYIQLKSLRDKLN